MSEIIRKDTSVKFKNSEFQEFVFRIFMKHVKANKLYLAFRWSVNHSNKGKDFIHVLSKKMFNRKYNESYERICRLSSPFVNMSTNKEIIGTLYANSHNVLVENTSRFQMELMDMINLLIHYLIEHAVIDGDFKILEKIGSAVFEEVGKKLFGDSFKDMTSNELDKKQREFIEKMQSMNPRELMNHLSHLPYRDSIMNARERMNDRFRLGDPWERNHTQESLTHHHNASWIDLLDDYDDDWDDEVL